MTERARLSDCAFALAARPRAKEYAVHDTALQGFMLCVQPLRVRSSAPPRRSAPGNRRHRGGSGRETL